MESEEIGSKAGVKPRPSELNIIHSPNNLILMTQESNVKTRDFAESIRGKFPCVSFSDLKCFRELLFRCKLTRFDSRQGGARVAPMLTSPLTN